MQAWAQRLATLGKVVAFDYAYMKQGRKRPDVHAQLVAAHIQALNDARANHTGPVVLIGKSMGGRISCHVALKEAVQLVVCMGYPLVAAHGGKVRDQVLLDLTTPVLFVQGTRDTMCPLDHLAQVRSKMRALNSLYVVETGDHSLLATKRHLALRGETQAHVDAAILAAVQLELTRLAGPSLRGC